MTSTPTASGSVRGAVRKTRFSGFEYQATLGTGVGWRFFDDPITTSVARSSVINSLALALGYSVRYNTDPPSAFSTTDTLTTLNLVYEPG